MNPSTSSRIRTVFGPKFATAAAASLLCACLAAGQLHAQAAWRFDGVERIVAVADVHGAYEAFETILEQAGVIDESLAWSGGGTHLVIVGDVLDRGRDSRRAMDLIMRLEAEAPRAGGRVLFVLGNHELMNLTGDLRYVSAGEYAAFAGEEPAGTSAAAAEAYPPGFLAHREAFSYTGVYGSWLLEHPLLVIVNDWAFVHGGLAPAAGELGAEGINTALTRQLSDYVETLDALIDGGILGPADGFYEHPDVLARFHARVDAGAAEWPEGLEAAARRIRELNTAFVFAADSPTWYRGNVGCGPLIEQDRLIAALSAVGAESLVVGHTPTSEGLVQNRLGQKLVRIDTGMLRAYYGGRAAALIIEGGRVSVLYENETAPGAVEPEPRRVGARPPGMSVEALEDFLLDAEVVSRAPLDERWERIVLREGEIELEAHFTPAARSRVRPDVAAFQLDRLLGLDMVPVTVARDIGGEPGSVQYAPPRIITEVERRAQRSGGGAWCPLTDQFQASYVFDSLIYNEGRTVDRIRYDTDNFQLILVGHDLSFSTGRGRPPQLAEAALELTPAWEEALRALDEATLTEAMGDVLNGQRIRALLRRRDAILEGSGL